MLQRDEGVLRTPDGRYLVVRGRLWRTSNPGLTVESLSELVRQLMDARRSVRGSPDVAGEAAARAKIDAAKRGLGERGPVWWADGAQDYNRKLAKNTPYAEWHKRVTAGAETSGS